jgi:hypothetical protein
MALKRKIDKAAFDKLPSDIKTEYMEKDGAYVLDIDGDEDTGALKRSKDRETQARKDAEKERDELRAQLDETADLGARKKGDIETLEKAWKKKSDDAEAAANAKIAKLTAHTSKTLIDGTAATMAAKISTVPGLMSKAIRDRLTVDYEGDEPTLRILGPDGKPSAMTIDQLSQEFVANKEFSSIIVGSKASGGGAAKDGFSKTNGGAGQQQTTDKPASYSSMSPRDLAASLTAKREASKE